MQFRLGSLFLCVLLTALGFWMIRQPIAEPLTLEPELALSALYTMDCCGAPETEVRKKLKEVDIHPVLIEELVLLTKGTNSRFSQELANERPDVFSQLFELCAYADIMCHPWEVAIKQHTFEFFLRDANREEALDVGARIEKSYQCRIDTLNRYVYLDDLSVGDAMRDRMVEYARRLKWAHGQQAIQDE